MGISTDGGDRVKGVDLLCHYSIELTGRGDVVEERLDFLRLFQPVAVCCDSANSQKGERCKDAVIHVRLFSLIE